MAMMATTTNSSMRVKAVIRDWFRFTNDEARVTDNTSFTTAELSAKSRTLTNRHFWPTNWASMDYLRSTADLLAQQLRTAIQRGELTNPLPNIREWSRTLEVSRTTLGRALKKLAAEDILAIEHRKGARILSKLASPTKPSEGQTRLVRALYCSRDCPWLPTDLDCNISLSERLQQHEIHVTLERCTDARLRAVAQRGERANEMFLLVSLPAIHQRRFERLTHSTLLVGMPASRIRLSSIGTDVAGIVRHAALTLMQHGFTRITMMLNSSRGVGVQRSEEMLLATCAKWQPARVQTEIIRMDLEEERMAQATKRFASRITGRHGLIVIRPVSLTAVLTALIMRGISIPDQVEIIAIESTPHTVNSCPS